jgi:hypothetical protein
LGKASFQSLAQGVSDTAHPQQRQTPLSPTAFTKSIYTCWPWFVLAPHDLYWPPWFVLAGPHDLYWPPMICTGPSWFVLAPHDLYWPLMICTAPSSASFKRYRAKYDLMHIKYHNLSI